MRTAAMRRAHNGIAATAALLPLQGIAPRLTCSGEAVIEFLSPPHTSLLDLAERKLGLFFASARCFMADAQGWGAGGPV
jgi:hypothetical protein